MWWSRAKPAAAVLSILLMVGCAPTPTASVGYQVPFAPFKLSIDNRGKISLSADVGKLVTPVGTFTISAGLAQEKKAAEGSTLLVVYTYVDGDLVAQTYEIHSGEELGFSVNGKVQGTVRVGRIELRADPGVVTTIDVFDPRSGERGGEPAPAFVLLPPDWSFTLPDPNPVDYHADLDARQVRKAGEASVSLSSVSWEFGYGLRSWASMGYSDVAAPTPEQCRDFARSNATGIIKAEDLRQGQNFCVETRKGNVALVRLTRIANPKRDMERATLTFSATVWVKTVKDAK